MTRRPWFMQQLVGIAVTCFTVTDDETADLIATVRAVGAEAAGSAEARAARDRLAAQGPSAIPQLLIGMDMLDTVQANWLRTAFDDVVARAFKSDATEIPAEQLLHFVQDSKRLGRVRRLALDVLTKLDQAAPQRLIPGLLDDSEFRYDAVAMLLADAARAAAANQTDEALAAYTRAFDAARDADQIRDAAAKLRSLGREVSIVEHMGFVVDWHIVGPFHGPNYTAFSNSYEPEIKVDLNAAYDGPSGKISWKRYRTPDEFGTVDLVKAVAAVDDAAAFAYTTVESPESRNVQIRCGADDNLTVWLNGKRVFAKEEWQNGTRLDRFIIPIQLVEGTNKILVKTCQGPKYQDPAMTNLWSMQIRLCNSDGRGARFGRLGSTGRVPLNNEIDEEPRADH